MLVLRTVCCTDWKGRPSHTVVLIAKTESREEAIEAMNKDVEEWQAADLAADAESLEEAEEGEEHDRLVYGPPASGTASRSMCGK